MAEIATKTKSNKLDPRVARTHRLLLDSFSELLADKSSSVPQPLQHDPSRASDDLGFR